MNSPTISVIVPVYNVEKYLPRCIDSILAQTFTDFELLLIDDGSKDTSGSICDEYAKKDTRIRVFHKDNGGVSSARNVGLDNAKGKWITFIDSDDWIGSSWLLAYLNNKDEDIIIQGYTYSTQSDKTHIHVGNGNYIDRNIDKKLYELETCPMSPIRIPWNKMYKLSIIKDNYIRFDQSVSLGEDYIFNINYMAFCRTLKSIDEFDYYYMDSPTGLNRKKYSYKNILEWNFKIIQAARNYSEKRREYLFMDTLSKKICLWLIQYIFSTTSSYKGRYVIMNYLLKNELFKEYINETSLQFLLWHKTQYSKMKDVLSKIIIYWYNIISRIK